MQGLRVEQGNSTSFLALGISKSKNLGASYKSILTDELNSAKTFEEICSETWLKYFGQSSTNYYHVMDATAISREVWTHNDFPYDKFLTNSISESVLTWQPARANPSQSDSDVQAKLTATLGKNAVIITPELNAKLKTDSALRRKVIANLENIYKFHTQPPAFHMPGVKEYGTKIYGSVTISNADGDVENCVVTSGGTIMGPDEETLRQFEEEQQRKLKRKEFNAGILEQARIEYLMARDLLTV